MAQINVTIDDQTSANLDRVAAARGEVRTDLLRKVIRETIEAHDAGRLLFEVEEPLKVDGTLNGLAVQLRDGVVELERTTRVTELRATQFVQAFTASEKAVLRAQERLTARVNDINRKSYEPFVAMLGELQGVIAGIVPGVAARQDAGFAKLEKRLDAILKAAEWPRDQVNLQIGANGLVPLRYLLGGFVAIVLVGFFPLLMFISHWDGISLRVVHRLVDNPVRLCRLIEQQYGTHDCTVPLTARQPALKTIRWENGQ